LKKNLCAELVLIFVFLISCATRRPVIVPPPPPLPPIQTAHERIKQNSPEIKKYFILDENRDIVVKADIDETKPGTNETEHFEVIYNLKHPEADGSGGFFIPFTISSQETGETKRDKLFWKPQRDGAGILLAFDDDYVDVWEQYFDFLDLHNARVTFFLQGEHIDFSIEALERGHDVGYHTQNHLNLTKVSREVFDEETLAKVDEIRSAGIPLTTFAYPFGLSEDWMNEELRKSFRIMRGYGVTFRVYDRVSVREGYSSSKALDNILFKRDEDFELVVDHMFRTIKFIGGNLILPLTTHTISDDADWGIKPDRLRYLLEAANKLQLNFYRYKDL